MSLFSRHKLSEYESSDYQQQLNEFKYKITKFEDRLEKLESDWECASQGESFQPTNGIDAKEAANRVEKAAQKALPNELKRLLMRLIRQLKMSKKAFNFINTNAARA